MASKNEEYRWFSEADAAALLKPIFEAVEQLHIRGIVHRDIRLEKIARRVGSKSRVILQVHGFEHAVCL